MNNTNTSKKTFRTTIDNGSTLRSRLNGWEPLLLIENGLSIVPLVFLFNIMSRLQNRVTYQREVIVIGYESVSI